MTDKIDDASYAEGRAAFASGVSLRTIVERIMASDDGTAADETRAMSSALGFADAFLDRMRDIASTGPAPIATVINNNQEGWTNIIETLPNVTLLLGTKLYLRQP